MRGPDAAQTMGRPIGRVWPTGRVIGRWCLPSSIRGVVMSRERSRWCVMNWPACNVLATDDGHKQQQIVVQVGITRVTARWDDTRGEWVWMRAGLSRHVYVWPAARATLIRLQLCLLCAGEISATEKCSAIRHHTNLLSGHRAAAEVVVDWCCDGGGDVQQQHLLAVQALCVLDNALRAHSRGRLCFRQPCE